MYLIKGLDMAAYMPVCLLLQQQTHAHTDTDTQAHTYTYTNTNTPVNEANKGPTSHTAEGV